MSKAEIINRITDKYEHAYISRMPKSRGALENAARVLPGGDSRITTFFYPFPLFIDEGYGCYIRDLDGHEYIDFHNCYTALIHGHAYPPIVDAVNKALKRFGPILGAPSTLISSWAETLCARLKSVKKIRFCNSGSEAVMMAVRTARAFSGKEKILKIEGGYNGSYDTVVHPSKTIGLPMSVQSEQITMPFNDKEAARRTIAKHGDELACVIVEGMMGAAGQIPPINDYIRHIRDLCHENSVIFVLDEVMTFRLGEGGLQGILGIEPDLTVLGKIIGGGFPAGAWGGREDLMELFDPIRGRTLIQDSPGLPAMAKVFHGGTFNANPITASAGKIMVEKLDAREIARINGLGERLAAGIREIFMKRGVAAQITGMGSLQNLHFTRERVVDFSSAQKADKELMHLVHLGLLERGILIPARGLFSLSTAMTEREVLRAVDAMDGVINDLIPTIKEAWPNLVC